MIASADSGKVFGVKNGIDFKHKKHEVELRNLLATSSSSTSSRRSQNSARKSVLSDADANLLFGYTSIEDVVPGDLHRTRSGARKYKEARINVILKAGKQALNNLKSQIRAAERAGAAEGPLGWQPELFMQLEEMFDFAEGARNVRRNIVSKNSFSFVDGSDEFGNAVVTIEKDHSDYFLRNSGNMGHAGRRRNSEAVSPPGIVFLLVS